MLICDRSQTALSEEKLASTDGDISQNSPANKRPLLKVGTQGVAVSELQAALKLLGYYSGKVDGVYSESTAIAVSQFQQAAGIQPNGIVDEKTWERLFPSTPISSRSNLRKKNELTAQDSNNNESQATIAKLPILKLGMRGSEVFWLQKRLQEIGFFQGSPDGVFGANTLKAVKAVQEKYELKSDGIVGPSTWKVLLP